MCGRYTMFASPEVLKQRFKSSIDESALAKFSQQPERYNIAPTHDVPVVARFAAQAGVQTSASNRASASELSFMRWGLVPSWAKDVSVGAKLINARAETILEKPSFRQAFQQRRCLVIASGFYEWKTETASTARGKPGSKAQSRKQPYYVSLRSGEPFALAGLWESWQPPARTHTQGTEPSPPLRTCTIITTTPNALIAPLHHRMAVILRPEDEDIWLDDNASEQDLMRLLRPFDDADEQSAEDGSEHSVGLASSLVAHPVAPLVSSLQNDSPALIVPVAPMSASAPASLFEPVAATEQTVQLGLFG
jgi:putative SOS response-associated peptidase YedK